MGFFISHSLAIATTENVSDRADVSFRGDARQHITYALASRQKKFESIAILRDDLRLRAWSRRYSAQEVKNITTAMRVFDRASEALLVAYDTRIASLQSETISMLDMSDREQIQHIYRAQDRLYNAYFEALYLH